MVALGANLSVVTSPDALRKQRLDVQLKQLEFNALLHRKLDLERLFECLLTEGQSFVSFDGLKFHSAERGRDIMLGFTRQYRQRFELRLGERCLGEIELMRVRAFTPRDERDAERLVESLIYPLDNALEHHQVLVTATTDSTTGLRNQRALEELLPREIRLVRRVEQPLALILMAVENLDSIEEEHGKQIGQCAWSSVAQTLVNGLRQSDLIFHIEEGFCIILNHTDLEGAMVLAERLRQKVDHCVSFDNIQFVLTASAGVTELTVSDDACELMSRVRQALQLAQQSRPNQVRAVISQDTPTGEDPSAA